MASTRSSVKKSRKLAKRIRAYRASLKAETSNAALRKALKAAIDRMANHRHTRLAVQYRAAKAERAELRARNGSESDRLPEAELEVSVSNAW